MKIDLLSINDKNGLDRVYILLNSLKQTKQADTEVTYHLILEDVEHNIAYFEDLVSDDFKLEFIQLTPFLDRINLPEFKYQAPANKYTMIRCLTPSYFSSIDKMLYIDTDTVFLQEGVEQLFNTDLTDYYLAGCEDIFISRMNLFTFERQNTKNHYTYINGGVILFNFKKIREDGLDLKLVEMCSNWNLDELKPNWLDQTLMNYVFREKIKLLDYKYNDFSLVTSVTTQPVHSKYLKEKYGYNDMVNSVKDAVILHFLGQMKPWIPRVRQESCFPFSNATRQIWKKIEGTLKKDEAKEV